MTFGMPNAGNTFQRLINRTLNGVENAFRYLDDILVFSKGEEDYRRHLQETFSRLRAACLTANPEKCEFGKTSIKFLGHTKGHTLGLGPDL